MTTLRQALEMTSWRTLVAIGRQRGLRYSSNILKADLIDRLLRTLPDPDNLRTALADLSRPEEDALRNILAAGGRLPRRFLRPPDGDIDSDRDKKTGRHRYLSSLPAPLKRLCALGLVFYDRAHDDLFVPDDLRPLLPAPSPLAPPPPAATQRAEPALLAVHDLGYLLALLQANDVKPLHGRWLPPRCLAAWGEVCARPPRQPQARGELQTGRRRFLHYLAQAAGWLGLSPLPALPPGPRFRLAAEISHQRIGSGLADSPDAEEVSAHPRRRRLSADESPRAATSPPGSPETLRSTDHPDELAGALVFRLAGAWPDPAQVMVLEGVGRKDAQRGVGRENTPATAYRVTAASFARALHQGWSAPALLEALNGLAERPLTGQETALLRRWAGAAGRATIRRLTVLETTDPGLIRRLASERRGRALIVRTLSPRAVVVDPARLEQLVRRLTRHAPRGGKSRSLPPAGLIRVGFLSKAMTEPNEASRQGRSAMNSPSYEAAPLERG